MGTNAQTEQDDYSGIPLITVDAHIYIRICTALKEIKLEFDASLLYSRLEQLANALNNFALNRGYWRRPNHIMSRRLLQQHLVFTLMVPGGKASQARIAVDKMTAEGLLPVPVDSEPPAHDDIAAIIRPYVRFPYQKTRRIWLNLLCWDAGIVRTVSDLSSTCSEMRKALINNVHGYGPKAASHFMRNTGLMAGWDALPIIDTHIHKALEALGFQHADYPTAEAAYQHLARLTGITPLLLDAVLWCVYSNNWDITHADFDNFGVDNTNKIMFSETSTTGQDNARSTEPSNEDPAGTHSQGFGDAACGYDSTLIIDGTSPVQ